MRKCNTLFFLENEEQKKEIEKYKEKEGELRLEIQSLKRQRDEAVQNRITEKSRSAARTRELKEETEEMKKEMTRINVTLKLQNETVEDKNRTIDKWEKKCAEADKKIAKVQREKEA